MDVKKIVIRNLIISLFFQTICVAAALILCYNTNNNIKVEGEQNMEASSVIALVVGILGFAGGIISAVISANTIKKNKIDTVLSLIGDDKNALPISSQLGVKKGELSVVNQIGVKNGERSLSNQIGVGNDDASLTGQHKTILSAINSYRTDDEQKMKLFTKKQKDTKQKIEEVADFLKDWEQKILEAEELKKENYRLNLKISELTAANSEQVAQLRSELTEANAVINQQSEMLQAINNEQDDELER